MSDRISEINELAQRCYHYYQEHHKNDDNGIEKIYHLFTVDLSDCSKIISDEIVVMIQVINEQLGYKMTKAVYEGWCWNPNMPPFYQSTMHLYKRRKNDVRSGGPTDIPLGHPDPKPNPEKKVVDREMIIQSLRLMNDTVRMNIKKSPNKICYYQLFYTGCITQCLYKNSEVLILLPSQTETCIDLAFADHYLEDTITELCDIPDSMLKPISEFSGFKVEKEPCGYPLLASVFQTYVRKITNGKKHPNDSAISQSKKKFALLKEEILGQLEEMFS